MKNKKKIVIGLLALSLSASILSPNYCKAENINSVNKDQNSQDIENEDTKDSLDLDKYYEKENQRLNDNLEKIIDEETEKLQGDYQVAIDTVKGKSDIHIDKKSSSDNKSQPSASTIKIFVALDAYKKVEENKLDENDIKDDVYTMLKDSNNEATNRLIDKVGGFESVDETIKNISGRKLTDLNRKMLHEGEENMANASDLNKGLKAISKAEYLNRENSDKLLKAMADNTSTSRTKLLANVNKDFKTYNKSGELANIGVQNDIALINTGESEYAISVLSDFPNPTSWDDGPQFQTLRKLGERTSEEFSLFDKRINSYKLVEKRLPYKKEKIENIEKAKDYKNILRPGKSGFLKQLLFKDPKTGKVSLIQETRKDAINEITVVGEREKCQSQKRAEELAKEEIQAKKDSQKKKQTKIKAQEKLEKEESKRKAQAINDEKNDEIEKTREKKLENKTQKDDKDQVKIEDINKQESIDKEEDINIENPKAQENGQKDEKSKLEETNKDQVETKDQEISIESKLQTSKDSKEDKSKNIDTKVNQARKSNDKIIINPDLVEGETIKKIDNKKSGQNSIKLVESKNAPIKKSQNVKTGVKSLSAVLTGLLGSTFILFKSKRK